MKCCDVTEILYKKLKSKLFLNWIVYNPYFPVLSIKTPYWTFGVRGRAFGQEEIGTVDKVDEAELCVRPVTRNYDWLNKKFE